MSSRKAASDIRTLAALAFDCGRIPRQTVPRLWLAKDNAITATTAIQNGAELIGQQLGSKPSRLYHSNVAGEGSEQIKRSWNNSNPA